MLQYRANFRGIGGYGREMDLITGSRAGVLQNRWGTRDAMAF